MPYIDQFGNYYNGDRQYSIVDGELIWDVEATSPKPTANSIPVIENGVHVGWQEPTKSIDEQIQEIEAKYNVKFEVLQKRLTNVILSDGIDQDAKTIILQNEYRETSDAMDLEIIELFGGM